MTVAVSPVANSAAMGSVVPSAVAVYGYFGLCW